MRRGDIGYQEGVEYEWLSPKDARFLAQSIQRIARNEAKKAVAEQQGSTRAYAWTLSDPNSDPPPDDPPAFSIEVKCRPLELILACKTAPTSSFIVNLQRSIDNGATYEPLLSTPAAILSGQKTGFGGVFLWEIPYVRTLVSPGTPNAYPAQLWVGDLIDITFSGGADIRSVTMQLRTERVNEKTRKQRRRRLYGP
jgi:hypothetical protein